MAGLNDKSQFELMDMINEDMPKRTELEKPGKLPKRLYLLPLVERPFFPPQTLPILLDIDPWLKTIEKASESKVPMLGLVLSRAESSDDASPKDIFTIGTAIRLHQPTQTENQVQVIAEGVTRFKIKKWIHKTAPFLVEVEYPQDSQSAKPEEDKAYAVAIINTLKELIPLNPLYSEELKFFLKRFIPNDPSHLADFAASLTSGTRD